MIKSKSVPQLIILFLIVLQSCSCNKNTNSNGEPDNSDGDNDDIEIQVGAKTFTTKGYTQDGTPVVPMWKAPVATEDLRNGAGFPLLQSAEHTSVWKPSDIEEGGYNHYACLIYYKGKFYAMWGNHRYGEDAPGQRVLYSTSETWGEWTDPQEMFAAPESVKPRGETGRHFKPDRWAIIDDILYAIAYVHGAGVYPIARSVDEDGVLGDPFILTSLPSNGKLPEYMEGVVDPNTPSQIGVRLYQWYRENDQISWWAGADWGVQRTSVDGQSLIESFIYRAKDGGLVLMLRDWGHNNNPVHNNRMYVSFNNGEGGWTRPHPSDIPDSPSRAQGITLEDGTVLLIGNQNVNRFDQALYLDRDPMTVSVSEDGYTFDRVYALRTGSPTGHRFSGISGRNPGYAYSSSIVHEGVLYTLYSTGKEDMEITRVPLSALGL